MVKHDSLKRNLRRHMIEDYGMSFRDMKALIHNDPVLLLEQLKNFDEEHVEENRQRRMERKHIASKNKKKVHTSNRDIYTEHLKTLNIVSKIGSIKF